MNDTESILCKMLLIRRVEEEIVARYSKQQMRCPVHLSCGQEAIAVGVCHYLKREDSVFSTHRSHAHYLAKGGDLDRMILEIHGKMGGCQDGRGGSMHLNDKSVNIMSIPIVASAIPLAVGVAMANKIDGNDNIVVCFFGDAAVEEGVFHESMNFASLMQLPIIFVCENNQYSVDTHISRRQPKRDLKLLGTCHSAIIVNQSNGNDVFYIEELIKSLIHLARKNNQPSFIVFDTKRSYAHCGVDKEFELKVDPLVKAVWDSKIHSKDRHYIDVQIKAKITAAFDAAEAAPLPTFEMAKEYVYA